MFRGDGSSVQTVVGALAKAWARERSLSLAGVTGLVLGLVALGALFWHGRIIKPEGDLARPLSFNVAVGIYCLTIAVLVPMARLAPRNQEMWRRWTIALVLGSLAIENVQTYRGLNPRFHSFDSPMELLLGLLFLLIGLGELVLFVVLATRLFQRRVEADEALLLLGARYGCVGAGLGFAGGLWMSAAVGARFGEAGNVLAFHALGFHALQAVPVVALLLGWGRVPLTAACRWVHVAGTAWLGACLALAWQALLGRVVFEASPATVVAHVLLLVWMLVMVRAAAAWLRCFRLPACHPATDQVPGLIASEPQPPGGAHQPVR
jgi:hypothetical protein